MNAWLPYVGAPLTAGPIATFSVAFSVSPGIPAMVAFIGERRVLHPRQEFVAFVYGDPLLALAAATGVALCGPVPPKLVKVFVNGPVGVTVLAGWLGFGIWQWRAEVLAGKYTRAQAFAPTKVWHQLVVYPVLGYLSGSAVIAGLATPGGRWAQAGKALITVCVAAWVVANVYDRRHLKLGHPPYDWRRLRPMPAPWPVTSATLRSASPVHRAPATWRRALVQAVVRATRYRMPPCEE